MVAFPFFFIYIINYSCECLKNVLESSYANSVFFFKYIFCRVEIKQTHQAILCAEDLSFTNACNLTLNSDFIFCFVSPPGKQESLYLTEGGREAFDQLYRLWEGQMRVVSSGTPSPLLPLPQDSQGHLVSDLLNMLIGVASTSFPLNQVGIAVNHLSSNRKYRPGLFNALSIHSFVHSFIFFNRMNLVHFKTAQILYNA